jgi:leader peptidase (prepilin peptidase) / N-methyltransferase
VTPLDAVGETTRGGSAVIMATVAALFGAIAGSFLNVCIVRLPKGESIVHPSSRCPECRREIRWYENVPIVSWIALRARCAGCRTSIPAMYPLVELTTAIVFALAVLTFGLTPILVVRVVFACSMIVLAVTDLRDRILPNAITYPGVVVGLLCSLFLPPGFTSALIGAVVFAGVLWAVGEAVSRWVGRDALGFGDVKMAAMIGAFLGWPSAIVTFALVGLVGTFIAIAVVVIKRDRYYEIPLGTMLAAAAVIAAFVGPPMIDWYLYSFSGLPR